jgi:hypothetical protein
MLRIHQSLQSGKFPNATILAAELEVSTKSIQRDLEFMRDRLELPIKYDPHRIGYHYTAEVTSFPTMHITEGELVALVIAEKALEQYRGTQFEKPLLSAIRKIEQSLPDTISLNMPTSSRPFRSAREPNRSSIWKSSTHSPKPRARGDNCRSPTAKLETGKRSCGSLIPTTSPTSMVSGTSSPSITPGKTSAPSCPRVFPL